MSNFKVDEKVVCISSPQDKYCQPRVKGQIYTITDIYTCSHGVQYLNIDNQINNSGGIRCACGCYIESHKWFTNNKHFRKLDHQFSEDVIAEIIKQVKEESLTLAN